MRLPSPSKIRFIQVVGVFLLAVGFAAVFRKIDMPPLRFGGASTLSIAENGAHIADVSLNAGVKILKKKSEGQNVSVGFFSFVRASILSLQTGSSSKVVRKKIPRKKKSAQTQLETISVALHPLLAPSLTGTAAPAASAPLVQTPNLAQAPANPALAPETGTSTPVDTVSTLANTVSIPADPVPISANYTLVPPQPIQVLFEPREPEEDDIFDFGEFADFQDHGKKIGEGALLSYQILLKNEGDSVQDNILLEADIPSGTELDLEVGPRVELEGGDFSPPRLDGNRILVEIQALPPHAVMRLLYEVLVVKGDGDVSQRSRVKRNGELVGESMPLVNILETAAPPAETCFSKQFRSDLIEQTKREEGAIDAERTLRRIGSSMAAAVEYFLAHRFDPEVYENFRRLFIAMPCVVAPEEYRPAESAVLLIPSESADLSETSPPEAVSIRIGTSSSVEVGTATAESGVIGTTTVEIIEIGTTTIVPMEKIGTSTISAAGEVGTSSLSQSDVDTSSPITVEAGTSSLQTDIGSSSYSL